MDTTEKTVKERKKRGRKALPLPTEMERIEGTASPFVTNRDKPHYNNSISEEQKRIRNGYLKRFTDDDGNVLTHKQKILLLLSEGYTPVEIYRKYALCKQYVYKVFNEYREAFQVFQIRNKEKKVKAL